MNPEELVNQDVKANANNFRLLKTIDDLKINVRSYLSKIQFNELKIRNFFKKILLLMPLLTPTFIDRSNIFFIAILLEHLGSNKIYWYI